MPEGMIFVAFAASLILPALVALRARAERASILLYVYLGILKTLGALLGQVLVLEFTLPVLGAVVVSAGSLLYGAFMCTAVLLALVTREAAAMRRVALLVLVQNIIIAVTFRLAETALRGGAVNPFGVDPSLFDFSFRLMATGGLLIILELYALVIILELTKRRIGSRLAFDGIALAAFVLIVTLDGLLFLLLGQPFAPDLIELITGGVTSKLVIGLTYAVPLSLYLLVSRRSVDAFRETPLDLQYLVVAPRDRLLERIDEASQHSALLQAKAAKLAEGMSEGLLTTGPDGRISAANDAAVALLAAERELVLGSRLEDLLPGAEDASPGPYVVTSADDRQLEVRVHRATDGALVFIRDATAELHRAEALEKARDTELRALDLQVEAELAKTSLLTSASHEFRTPVTVLYGGIETLVQHEDVLTPEQRRDLQRSLQRQATRLAALVEDLFVVSQSRSVQPDAPQRQRTDVDVAEIVRATVADSEVADRVTIEGPETLLRPVNEATVSRILSNLLSNVTKYAPEGPCRVRLEATETGCTLLVTDEGPGLPARMHEPVFDAFVRADHHHPQPGTGIGLHLVRHLATLTGGSATIVPSDRGLHVLVEISDQFPLELDARTSPSRAAPGGTDRDSERED